MRAHLRRLQGNKRLSFTVVQITICKHTQPIVKCLTLVLRENVSYGVSLRAVVCVPVLFQSYSLIGCYITDVERRYATARDISTLDLHQVSYKQNELIPEVA